MELKERTGGIYEKREGHSVSFAFSFMFIFALTAISLGAMGLTPDPIGRATSVPEASNNVVHAETREMAAQVAADVLPRRLVIESVDIDTSVNTPESKDIAVLDDALLGGAVHYPGSGNLSDTSAMFIFGHSSHLPIVNNKNFQAFNDLEDVKEGALIRVESHEMVNLYRVSAVKLLSADDALIPLGGDSRKLVLSTCNSFGKPTDRYVVEADYVTSYTLPKDGIVDR